MGSREIVGAALLTIDVGTPAGMHSMVFAVSSKDLPAVSSYFKTIYEARFEQISAYVAGSIVQPSNPSQPHT